MSGNTSGGTSGAAGVAEGTAGGTAEETAPDRSRAVEAFEARVDGVTMTGLVTRVERPRAVLLALHGGGSRAAYWHGTAHPDQSLLTLAARLGFTAVAIDQPGYAASAGQVDSWSLERRADLVARTLDAVVADLGAGVVVVAHSQGTQVGTVLAARSGQVIGLDFSGNGRERQPVTRPPAEPPVQRRQHALSAIWGSPHLYPEGALTRRHLHGSAIPRSAYEDASMWSEAFPRIAARVTVPVRVTVAEHEGIWASSPDAQARLAGLFTAAPRVHTAVQSDAPHNISLSSAARAYHLHVLAFAEECALWARLTAISNRSG